MTVDFGHQDNMYNGFLSYVIRKEPFIDMTILYRHKPTMKSILIDNRQEIDLHNSITFDTRDNERGPIVMQYDIKSLKLHPDKETNSEVIRMALRRLGIHPNKRWVDQTTFEQIKEQIRRILSE